MRLLNNNTTGNFIEIVKEIPNNYIDLTVTSPPYDNLRTYNNEITGVKENGFSTISSNEKW